MAWPTAKPNSTSFDADSDRISASRADLLTMSQAVNDIVDFIESTLELKENSIKCYC